MVFDNNMNKLVILFVVGIILLVGINFYKKKMGEHYATILSIIVILVCGYFGYMIVNEQQANNVANVANVVKNNAVNMAQNNAVVDDEDVEDAEDAEDSEDLMEEFANSSYENEPPSLEHFENNNEDEVKDLEKRLNESIAKNDVERAVELVRKISELKGKSQVQIETDVRTVKELMGAKLKGVFNCKEFLPKDKDSVWSKNAPDGQGDICTGNLLNAGHHLGINTQGCSMRNANRGLRSEPHNPQKQVSPWMQSTICPDLFRKPLDGSE